MWETSKITVSVAIHGDGLDPDWVTRLVGTDPDKSRRSEAAKADLAGQAGSKRGFWGISTEGLVSESEDTSTQIRSLLDRMTSDPAVWTELSQAASGRVFVGWFLVKPNEMISIEPELLGQLADRHLALDFDVYEADDHGLG